MEADSQQRRPVRSTGERRGQLSRARKAREQGDGLGTPTKVNIETSGPCPATWRMGPENLEGGIARTQGTARHQTEARPCE